MTPLRPKLVTEGIGTFFLVLAIGLTVVSAVPYAPLAIGAALCGLVYMGGPTSGAHYNPAVTLAFLLRGRITVKGAGAYVLVQFAGALLAAPAVLLLLGEPYRASPGPDAGPPAIFLAELLFTLLLVLVILQVATAPRSKGNGYYGLAIGMTVAGGAAAVGGISGGALNPAVGLGPAIFGAISGSGFAAESLLYYGAAPLLGGVLGAVAFKLQGGNRDS